MHPILRLSAAAVAGLAGLAAIVFIQWPGWAAALAAGRLVPPWQGGTWSLVLVDSTGHAGPPVAHGFVLVAITALLTVTVFIACFDAIAPAGTGSEPQTVPMARVMALAAPTSAAAESGDSDADFNAEVVRVLALLRAYMEANGLHGGVLAKANAQLPALATPEQVRMIVSYLMVENESMRNKTRALQNALEQSRQQVDRLKSHLAAAKAEGVSDSLTALKNRRGFDLTLASEVAAARENTKPLSLVMTDIDRFKAVNDRLGHPAGDEVLRWFSRILATNMKGRDTVARYGGEEFALILPQTDLENATSLAGQIRAQLEHSAWQMPGSSKTTLTLTASFGVAELRGGESTDALIRRADAKLYEAKQTGRNKVVG